MSDKEFDDQPTADFDEFKGAEDQLSTTCFNKVRSVNSLNVNL